MSVEESEAKFERLNLPRLRKFLEGRSVVLVLDNLESLLRDNGEWREPRWGKLVAALLSHRGSSRAVLTSRIKPVVPGGPRPGERARGAPGTADPFPRPLGETGLARPPVAQPGAGVLKGAHAADGHQREAHRQLVQRMLHVVQGHPKLIRAGRGPGRRPDHVGEEHLGSAAREDAWIKGCGRCGSV